MREGFLAVNEENEQAYDDFLALAHQYFAKADVITVDDGCLLSSWSFDNEVFETSYESEGDLYEVSLDFEMIKAFKVGDGVFSIIAPNGYTYDFAFFSLTKLSLIDV